MGLNENNRLRAEGRELEFAELRELLKEFNFKEVFLWLQVTATHPGNLLYSSRFDALTALALSISEEEFRGNCFNREECKRLFDNVQEKYGKLFGRFEDFEPLDQLKLIPYFVKEKKYYFFYGGLERPYEYLRKFHNMYLRSKSDKQAKEIEQIEAVFGVSLEFQDKLLKTIQDKEESRIRGNKVYVPTRAFFDDVVHVFKINDRQRQSLRGMETLDAGSFSENLPSLKDKLLTCSLFESFRVRCAGNVEFFLWPGRHIETLFAFANKLIRKPGGISEIGAVVHRNSVQLLKRFCAQFFTIRGVILDIYSAPPSDNLTEPIDMIGVVDGGKVILFKMVEPDYDLEITECIRNTVASLQGVRENIKKQDAVGFLRDDRPDKLAVVPTSVVEIFTIAVFQRTTLDTPIVHTSGITEDEHTRIFSIIDLQSMFEILSSPLSFLKFLRNEWELRGRSKVLSLDYLDKFIYYIENGESFGRQGIDVSVMYFASHSWSDYYNTRMHEKYSDRTYELIEKYFPGRFNYVRKVGDAIYNVADTTFLDAGVAVKFGKGLILISLPSRLYYCEDHEVRSSEFLSNLYSYYLDKLAESLSEFVDRHKIRFDEFYNIWILPVSYVKREKINYLRPEISKVSAGNQVTAMTGRVKETLILRTCILYESDYLPEIFSGEDNSGERYCFGKLIRSLLRYYNPLVVESEIEGEVKKFLDQSMPLGIKAYSYEAHPVENPKADEYRSYEELNKAERARVDREIARFLANSEICPGEYSGKEAQNLLGSICEFIQEKLEGEISKYDERFLYYAYRQLEYIEGERQRKVAQAGLHMSKYTEFDVAQRNLEETMVLGKAAVSVRLIVTTILKVGSNGKDIPDTEAWNYVHALSSGIQDISGMYECVRYDILPHTITISELFGVQYVKGEEAFDQYRFYRVEAEKRVDSAKERYIKRDGSTKSKPEMSKDLHDFLERLDRAFESEYGFKYQDMLVLIYALGKCDIPSGIETPLNIISEGTVLKYLKNMIIEDCPSEECLRKILGFISLDFKSYQSDEKLFYAQLLRRKERLNLCPVIRVASEKYLYGNEMCLGATRLWSNFVREGSFPYRVDESSPIYAAIEKYRRRLDKKLERQAAEVVSEVLGQSNVEANIANFKRLSRNFPRKPACGEIDLLAVNKSSKRVYLLDAKNRPRRIRPYDIRQDIDTFLKGKKSYLRKLVAKERFVIENFAEVLKHFGINDIKGWKIRKAFVVAQHYQVAHYKTKSVDFVEVEGLKSYIGEENTGPAGDSE